MIITIICTLLLLYAIIQYINGKYASTLYIFVFFATSAFIANLGSPLLKYKDYGLLLLLICCFIGRLRDRSFFKIKGLVGAKISLTFLFFFIFEFLYGCIEGVGSVTNILSVIRDYLFALSYFVFRKAPASEINKSVKWIYKSVMLVCALFIIQYFTHIQLTESYIAEDNIQIGNYRMQSTPPFIALILLSLLFYLRKIKFRWFGLAIVFGVLFISQNRTPLIALFLEIGLFLLFERRTKYKIPILIVVLLVFPFVNSLLSSRSADENSASNLNIPVWSYISQGNYQGLAYQSNFMFRIALIAERADYLLINPDKFLLGIGPMHEDTAQKKFSFKVGTAKVDEHRNVTPSQLDSIDVVWGPLLIRYGFLGVALHVIIILIMVMKYYERRYLPTMMLGFLTYVAALAQSFTAGGMFYFLGIATMMGFLITYDRKLELFKTQVENKRES